MLERGAGNASRNPRRTAATATALLIGVTLTTTMVVGASSTRATAQAGLAANYPTDVIVETYEGIPVSAQQQLASTEGVLAATGLTRATVTGSDGEENQVTGIDPAQALPVLRSADRTMLPEPGQIAVPAWSLDGHGVQVDGTMTLDAGDRSRTFTVVAGTDSMLLLDAVDLQGLVPDAPVQTMWLRLADGIDQNAATDELTDLAGTALSDPFVTGLASERAAMDSVVDVLLLIVTGLLGIAVLIALIGVGNTLALSVVERRQESGLLRALGLTRGQLRGLLAWEAVLVAGVAAVLGTLVGGAYGLAGATSALGQSSETGTVVISIPWLQVAAIVLVATAAGLLASVLPARRAARIPPVAAIAG
ncbi:ABC transporter permease [Modestobacter sp. VKM Ac-2978]|uniref:ABC transporter permease n=1 Tax=Modestobacter sp. VKM Ac-2978 TaxID=3004132 RepID=UPI0022AADB76|nr:ABC transporter permease [Modestobacter sp. VKM Ac-2978]MCZ2849846.1 ABC transporter permease [Modestobacter sp. VKM Ac-2978]